MNGVAYPAGSFVVKTAQPFRAHVLDMFEPQRYPDDEPPYDIAGWTLALQMGVKFDRLFESFDGPLERVERVSPPRRAIEGDGAAGFLISHHQNDSAVVVNRLLSAGLPVYWLRDRSIESRGATGSIYVPGGVRAREVLTRGAQQGK